MVASRFLRGFLLIALLALTPFSVADAQESTPSPQPAAHLDLAAAALTPADVPPGFFDEYSEWWVPVGAIDGIIGDAVPPDGLERAYQSFFVSNDSPLVINTFVLEFESPEAAAAGTSIVESGLRPPLPDGTTSGPTQDVGPDIAGVPSVLTTVQFDTRVNGGPFVSVVANSFVRDSIVGAVSIESYVDPPADGSLVPEGTPADIDAVAQEQLATTLATILDERVAAILTGGDPGGLDLTLPDKVLPIQQLVSESTPVLGGYKAGADLLECRVCGEETALGSFSDANLGGFARMVSVGPIVEGEPTPPFMGVAVSQYDTPENALAVIDAIRAAPNDLPTAYPVPRGDRTIAADPTIPGADASLAYTAILDPEDPSATADSAGVTFVQGTYLVTIDVQGGLTADQALEIATDLASQQAGCLASSEPCSFVSITLPR